jgi:hypothetical protein
VGFCLVSNLDKLKVVHDFVLLLLVTLSLTPKYVASRVREVQNIELKKCGS